MHCNTKFLDSQAEKTIGSRIDHFFYSYCVGSLLNQAGIRKLGACQVFSVNSISKCPVFIASEMSGLVIFYGQIGNGRM